MRLMKKYVLSLLILVLACPVFAQQSSSTNKAKPLVKTITLQMPRTSSDDNPGTRGASVAWHPVQKKYYAAMAGNRDYPLAVFDAKGKQLSPDTANCNADIRGFWFNSSKLSLEGNTYGDPSRQPYGLIRFQTDGKGIIRAVTSFQPDISMPGFNAVGCLHPAKQQVLFYYDGFVYRYSLSDGKRIDSLSIELGNRASDGKLEDFTEWERRLDKYNNTTMLYTGIKGAEWGLLNYIDRQIELYDEKTHFLTRVYSLPSEASSESSFNLAFCNNQFWFFDMDTREWKGYRF